MGSTFELQRWLYAGAIDALHGLRMAGLGGLPVLVTAAFGFGMLHALLPRHGKAVLTSYYAGEGCFRGGNGDHARHTIDPWRDPRLR